MPAALPAYRAACALEATVRGLRGRSGQDMPLRLEDAVRFGSATLTGSASPSLVLFVGTIGEFNAVRAFTDAYRRAWPEDRVILLAGRAQYAESLHEALPEAIVALPTWRVPAQLDAFFRHARPRLVAYAEGPSLHARFPIRLELPLSAACLHHHVPLIVLNAKVYDWNLASRVDRFDHLFAGLHRQAVRHWFVADDGFKENLRRAGAPEERIAVVGDLKFDSAAAPREDPPAGLAALIDALREEGGPLVVGGSVNALDDQESLISAWLELKQAFPAARLVIAPRYLEHAKMLQDLFAHLASRGIGYQRRSQDVEGKLRADVLIVDVFGELRFYYEIADICYVGRNHGILEPLRYRKPTVVAADWRRDHPSFPLYHQIVAAGAVVQVADKTSLGATFIRLVRDRAYAEGFLDKAVKLIETNAGSVQRIMQALRAAGDLSNWERAREKHDAGDG
jgi:3-deoxy-D-manno-octulosonic-acid transferase